MIYLIPNFLLVIITHNDYFIKDLLKIWSKDSKLLRYDLAKPERNLIKRFLNGIKNLLIIKNILENNSYKIVFFEWGAGLLERIVRLFQINSPIIARFHRYELYEKDLFKINFNKIDRVILVSEFMRKELLKKIPHLEKKAIVIPHSIKLGKFYPPKNKQINFKICTFSRLISVKRLDLIIEAMLFIKNPKVKLYIGGEGPERTRIEKKIRQNKLENKVFLEGWKYNSREWFEDKDIIVNASDIESFAVSIIEGMGCGVIPFIRGWGAAKDLYPKEFILPYDEMNYVSSVAQHIDEFYNLTEADQNSMRLSVRQYIVKHYSFEKQIQNFNSLFAFLLNRPQIPSQNTKKQVKNNPLFLILHYLLVNIIDFFYGKLSKNR